MNAQYSTRTWILLLASIILHGCAKQPVTLWPGTKYTAADKTEAMLKGIQFIYDSSLDPENFKKFGEDYLWCYYSLGAATANPKFKETCLRMGQERAKLWRQLNQRVPDDADVDMIYHYAYGSYGADKLGIIDEAIKEQLKRAIVRFTPEDLIGFDPTKGPIPTDIPEPCHRCKTKNARGVKVCKKCGAELTMVKPHDLLFEALVATYSGDAYGVPLGASFADVAQWIPQIRPYEWNGTKPDWNFYTIAYTITHIVYTLNDYNRWRLKKEWLPQEYAFLKKHLRLNIQANDPETLGEFVDSLKAFGMTNDDPEIREAIEYLLSHQNPDGSWGNRDDPDIYNRYHTTWCSVGALMDFAWLGEGVTSKEALNRILAK